MAVKTYSKGSKQKLSKNFYVSEFACHGAGCCGIVKIDTALVDYLQTIRDHFGKEIIVTSGFRCSTHNKNIGGATGSYHTKGMAADISVNGVAPADVAKYAESIGVLGIGLYETIKDGFFVHIDTRTTKSFWYGQAEEYRSTFGGQSEEYSTTEFVKDIQKVVGAVQDGIVGRETMTKTVTISEKTNQTHPAVRPVQKRLSSLGYAEVGIADGIAGKMFTAALSRFQSDNECTPTGMAEEWGKTWYKLFTVERKS